MMEISSIAQTVPATGGKVVLAVGGRPLFQLNSVSSAIWTKLSEGLPTHQIIRELATQFNVSLERVTNDVNSFVETLKQHDLVKDGLRTPAFHVDLVWNKGIAARCGRRVPDEFPAGLGYASALEPAGHSVPPHLLEDLISNPEVYREIKDGDVVWLKFSWVKSFLKQVLPLVRSKFILVTADSDLGAPLPIMAEALEILEYPNVMHWFAQNCDGPGFMGRMSPIPIGIDFHTLTERPLWGENVASPQEQEQLLLAICKGLRPARERIRKVYVDFAWQPTRLYHASKRLQVLEKILLNECVFFQRQPLPRSELWRTWGQYAFVLSPHGIGLDCHR